MAEYQGGLRRGTSTVDHVFTETNIGKMLGTKYDVTHVFTDFQAACDTIWR